MKAQNKLVGFVPNTDLYTTECDGGVLSKTKFQLENLTLDGGEQLDIQPHTKPQAKKPPAWLNKKKTQQTQNF